MILKLNPSEITTVEHLATAAVERVSSTDDAVRWRELSLRAHDLPLRLQQLLDGMKQAEATAICVISGIPIDDDEIGPTPAHWATRTTPSPAARQEAVLLMCGSLLGDAFGWATQQNGAIVHDILPIRGQEHEQLAAAASRGCNGTLKRHSIRSSATILG